MRFAALAAYLPANTISVFSRVNGAGLGSTFKMLSDQLAPSSERGVFDAEDHHHSRVGGSQGVRARARIRDIRNTTPYNRR